MRLLLFASVLVSVALGECPAGTVAGSSSDDCFLFSTKPLPWQQAEQSCASSGGHLASIADTTSNSLVKSLLPTNCSHVYWIGGSIMQRTGGKGAWTWSDGTAWTFTKWAPAQPTSQATICTVYDVRSGQWYSEMCASPKPYICKFPSNASVGAVQQVCSQQTSMPTCEAGWSYFSGTGKCYKVLDGNGTWAIHESKCNLVGGHLASVHSTGENNFIRDLASLGKTMPDCTSSYCSAAVWIGMYRNCPISHVMKWSDGTEYDFKSWAPLRPNLLIFPEHTYVSMYTDAMAMTTGLSGKWDHYMPATVTKVRAGVCKRDY